MDINKVFNEFEQLSNKTKAKFYLAEGHNCICYLYKDIVIKYLSEDSFKNGFEDDYYNFLELKELLPFNIPDVFFYNDSFFVQEYIGGFTLKELIDKKIIDNNILDCLFDLLVQLKYVKIHIEDLNASNLIYSEFLNRFYIIDIESYSIMSKKINLPNFLYLKTEFFNINNKGLFSLYKDYLLKNYNLDIENLYIGCDLIL